jgi:glyoxylase-like metal-dependent hydrolase (beta-lactamase superfamily II)
MNIHKSSHWMGTQLFSVDIHRKSRIVQLMSELAIEAGKTPLYEVYACRYARHSGRTEADNIIGGDPHSGEQPIDYYVWAIRSPDRTIVVDLGFSQAEADRRGRTFLECPSSMLRRIGIEPSMVEDVIITHLHYDHAGNQALFPNARFHLQDSEIAYATGRKMTHAALSHAFSVDCVVDIVRHVFGGRVVFHDGFGTFAPGIELHRIGGHTAGLQVVRVWTAAGWLLLASDAAHLYANLAGRPFPILVDMGAMLEGHRRLAELADPDMIVPGHDPQVMDRFPAAGAGFEGSICRLDLGPSSRGQ